MEILYFILFIVYGTFVGIVSGFFGIGGGSVVVPTLMAVGFSLKDAVGVSIVQMLFSSIYGSYLNYKAEQLKLNDGVFVGIGGFLGASFSGFVLKSVPALYLEIFLAFVLFVSIAKFFITTDKARKEINSKLLLFLIGFFIGLFCVSIGIGGGVFLTPILVGFLGYDIKKAVSMGLFFVMFSSVSGFLSMLANVLIDLQNGIFLGVGSLFGVYIGVKLNHKVNKGLQKRLLLALYILMFAVVLKKIILG